jgi:hypothetical protein
MVINRPTGSTQRGDVTYATPSGSDGLSVGGADAAALASRRLQWFIPCATSTASALVAAFEAAGKPMFGVPGPQLLNGPPAASPPGHPASRCPNRFCTATPSPTT